MLLTIALLALNFAVSWFNCWSVGMMWRDAKILGGFARVLAWSGATQSAIGFSSLIGAALIGVLHVTGHMPPKAMAAVANLWYLLIIIPAIGTGLIITIHSWMVALREKNIIDYGIAAYNTAAQISNMYDAAMSIGPAFESLTEFFSSDDDEDSSSALIGLVIGVVVIALGSGIALTAALIGMYSRRAERQAFAA